MRKVISILLLVQTYFDFRVGWDLVHNEAAGFFQAIGWFSLPLAVLQSLGLLYSFLKPSTFQRLQHLFVISVFGPLVLALLITMLPPFYLVYLLTLAWKAPGILGIALHHYDLSKKDLVPT